MLFWNHWSAKLQLQSSDRVLSSLWLGVHLNVNQYPALIVLSTTGQPSVDDMPPWNTDESCESLIIYNVFIGLWVDSRGRSPEHKPATPSEYLKGASSICCCCCCNRLFTTASMCNALTTHRFLILEIFFSCMCSSILHISFFSKVNIFIHYPDAAITLTPHTKLSREAEKDRLLHWHAAAKTNSLTSEHGVLLDWICLPACLCQSQTETKRGKGREIWRRDHNA